MGEKGIAAEAVSAAVAGNATASVVERATTVVTSTVTGAGAELLDTVRDKSIGAVADNIVAEGRQRLGGGGEEPAADEPAGGDSGRGETPPAT